MQGFGRFELQLDQRRLLCAGEPVALGGRAFDLLVALWERRDRVVDKAELVERVWPSVVVEENNLQVQIGHLRKVLGAEAISTVPGRGYRFTGVADRSDAGRAPDSQAGTLQPKPPVPRERLIGRETGLAALSRQLEQHALVTLVGAGGIGKTLLAEHLAAAQGAAFPGGVAWAALAELDRPGLVAPALARALGIQTGTEDPLAALCAALAPRRLLIVIDNAEHLIDAVAAVARAILRAAPAVRLLVTSQAPLLLSGECRHRLGPLAVPERPLSAEQALRYGAVALFAERARAADADFVLTDARADVVALLCRQLDGSPLAIELLAARVHLLGVRPLAGLMRDPLRLLVSGGKRDAPARQQALRAGLARSHDLLGKREQVVFRRLAVFTEAAPLDVVRQVVSGGDGPTDGWAAMDALGVLVDRSLVERSESGNAPGRDYRLAHLPRAFAMERLVDAGEFEAVNWRHTLWRRARVGRADGRMSVGEGAVDPGLQRPGPSPLPKPDEIVHC